MPESEKRREVKREKMRMKTYTEWPSEATVPKELVARAGFYHIGPGDRVRCAFCYNVLRLWDVGDIPEVEHGKYFRSCPMVKNRQGCGNIPLLDDTEPERAPASPGRTDFTNMNVYSNSSIVKILTPWSSTMWCGFYHLFFDYHMSWMSVDITTQVFLLSVTNCTSVSQILLKIRLLKQYPLATSLMPVNLIVSPYLHFQYIQRFNVAISIKILILYMKILIMYMITCIFSCAFTKLTILYIHVHILLYVNKIYNSRSSYLSITKRHNCHADVYITNDKQDMLYSHNLSHVKLICVLNTVF